jgi:hypothetical protein
MSAHKKVYGARLSNKDERFRAAEMTPEQQLLSSVLIESMNEAVGQVVLHGWHMELAGRARLAAKREAIMLDARAWIFGSTPYLETKPMSVENICAALGIDVDALRQRVANQISDAASAEQP